ncbi:family 16 glycoside hydrolase [Paenibacillus sp. 1P07SE]|uniref:family 16 glycoside hydrolase n=1 Tax=Paenibacillus sp. 1P07SE TaxID=3132209 RepID=UPI0039A6D0B0
MNGTEQQIEALSGTMIPGAAYTLRIDRIGEYIDVYLNGSYLGQGSDASLAGGQTGIGSSNSKARFDNYTVLPISDGIQVDVTAPEVFDLQPDGTDEVSGTVQTTVTATDDRGVASVQFRLNGLGLGSPQTTSGGMDEYSVSWDTTLYPNGEYTLTARAVDAAGNAVTSPGVTVIINNTARTTLITEDFSVDEGGFEPVRGGTWSVTDGQYRVTSPNNLPTNGNLAIHETIVSGDYTVSMDAANTGSWNGFRDFSIILEYQDLNNFYYANFGQQVDANTGAIFKVENGTRTKLADIPVPVHPPTMYSVAVKRDGHQLEAYVSGVLAASVTDSTFTAGGKSGLGTVNDVTVFDNFAVVQDREGDGDPEPPEEPAYVIEEDFSQDAANFSELMGGWSVQNGVYILDAPDRAQTTGNGNLSIHNVQITNDFILEVEARNTGTNNGFRDYSVIFDYIDADNYSYVSMHQDAAAAGIFKVTGGTISKSASLTVGTLIGTWQQVKIQRQADQVEVYLDDMLIGSNEATANSGRIGLGSLNDVTEFDNLKVTTAIQSVP